MNDKGNSIGFSMNGEGGFEVQISSNELSFEDLEAKFNQMLAKIPNFKQKPYSGVIHG